MLRTDFRRGLSLLHDYDFTYDILIYPVQLEAAIQTVRDFPLQKFVVDHIAKPEIKAGEIDAWAQAMREMARSGNTWCKVSGMITEAGWQTWKYEELIPYLDVIFEAFGEDRILFGSDWPVCLLAGTYEQVKGIVTTYLGDSGQHSPVWGRNATAFYSLRE
jgi:L-fuconolactonase